MGYFEEVEEANLVWPTVHGNHKRIHHQQVKKQGVPHFEIWTPADGRVLKIVDMTDSHLNNAIMYIEDAIDKGRTSLGMNKDIKRSLSVMHEVRIFRNLPVPLLVTKSED